MGAKWNDGKKKQNRNNSIYGLGVAIAKKNLKQY